MKCLISLFSLSVRKWTAQHSSDGLAGSNTKMRNTDIYEPRRALPIKTIERTACDRLWSGGGGCNEYVGMCTVYE